MNPKISIHLKRMFSKPWQVILAAIFIFLPLIFIGTHTSHDWGDDFAQYIHQAVNVVNGIPQSETGYIYNDLNPGIGPKAYTMGFPFLLAPVYAVAGNNIESFIILISLLYIVLGVLIIVFYRRYFSWITALVLAIVFMYNPQMILFKSEVMSDIPFTALLVLNFILYHKLKPGNLKQIFILALLTGFLLTLRPVGIVFMAAILTEQFVFFIRRKIKIKDFLIIVGPIILIPVLVYYIINVSIFKIPSGGGLHDYLIFFDPAILFNTISENLAHYAEALRYLYVPQSGILMGFSLVLGSVMVTMTVTGFLKRMLQGPEAVEWFTVFYMIVLLGYHYSNSATRLMIPLGFLFLFYATTGLKTNHLLPGVPARKKTIAIGIMIMILYVPGIINISRSYGNTVEGPQKLTAVETFEYINKNVPAEAVVVFAKPRALALYAGCQSVADPQTPDPTQVHKQVIEANASYILIYNKLTNEEMQRYTRVMQSRLTKLFENKDFVLYRINPVSR